MASRYEWFEADTPEGADLSDAPSLRLHQEVAFGANLWLNEGFVVKASLHLTNGNFFAGPAPQELVAFVDAGILDHRTRLGMLGVQFSF